MLNLKSISQGIALIASIGFYGLLLFPKPSEAQVNISPIIITTDTKQGTASGFVTLTNKGDEPITMSLSASPFTYDLNGFKALESSPNDLSPYLIFSPTEVLLAPKQVRRVRLLSRLLPSMKSGEYRAVVFVEPPKQKVPVRGMAINTRIGVTVYVRHGEIHESLVPEKSDYDATKKELNLVVKNTGNVTIRPAVTWELAPKSGDKLQGSLSAITIIAEGSRNINISFQKDKVKQPIPSGKYQLTGKLSWGDPFNPSEVPFDLPVTIP
jgi:P pilus assembly chaperone PapD